MRHVMIVLCLTAGLLVAASAGAATFQLDEQPDGHLTFMYRFQHPNFNEDEFDVDVGLLSGYHELAAHVPVSESGSVILELPIGYVTGDDVPDDYDTMAFGNIYTGFHMRGIGMDDDLSLTVGAFLPTAQSGSGTGAAREFGMMANLHDYYRHFFDDMMVVGANLALDRSFEGGAWLTAEFGPDMMISTEGEDDRDETVFRYGLGFGVERNQFDFGVEFSGFWVATLEDTDFGDASFHTLSFGADYQAGRWTPGLYLVFPQKDDFDMVDMQIGVRVSFTAD